MAKVNATSLKIDGVAIKLPDDLDFERYNLTKSGRVASGKMTMDIIAKKRKFLFTYNVIRADEFDTIVNILDKFQSFFNFQYVENDVAKSAIVYVGAIKYKRFRSHLGWYYKNFTFDLIEQ